MSAAHTISSSTKLAVKNPCFQMKEQATTNTQNKRETIKSLFCDLLTYRKKSPGARISKREPFINLFLVSTQAVICQAVFHRFIKISIDFQILTAWRKLGKTHFALQYFVTDDPLAPLPIS